MKIKSVFNLRHRRVTPTTDLPRSRCLYVNSSRWLNKIVCVKVSGCVRVSGGNEATRRCMQRKRMYVCLISAFSTKCQRNSFPHVKRRARPKRCHTCNHRRPYLYVPRSKCFCLKVRELNMKWINSIVRQTPRTPRGFGEPAWAWCGGKATASLPAWMGGVCKICEIR